MARLFRYPICHQIESRSGEREGEMRNTTGTRLLGAVGTSLMLAAVVACAPAGSSARTEPLPVTLVEVSNNSWYDVVVYSVGSGPRWRLGMVTSLSRETFRVPRRDILSSAGLRLMADPIGSSERYVSDRILTSPGDQVSFTVTPRVAQSYYAIRP